MKHSTLLAVGLVVVGLVAVARPPAGPVDDPPIGEPPSAETRAAVAPISAKLAGHPNRARQLAAFYRAAAEAIRRDGQGARVIQTTADLRTFCGRAVTVRFQRAFAPVPGLAETIHGPDGALSQLLALEVTELDHAETAAALDAIAWACREANS